MRHRQEYKVRVTINFKFINVHICSRFCPLQCSIYILHLLMKMFGQVQADNPFFSLKLQVFLVKVGQRCIDVHLDLLGVLAQQENLPEFHFR